MLVYFLHMDPQTPNPSPTLVPDKPSFPEPLQAKDNHWITILSMAVFVLLSLGAVAFLYYQNQQLKQIDASYQTPFPTPTVVPTVTPVSTPSPSASASATLTKPIVTSPKPGTKVVSPLT